MAPAEVADLSKAAGRPLAPEQAREFQTRQRKAGVSPWPTPRLRRLSLRARIKSTSPPEALKADRVVQVAGITEQDSRLRQLEARMKSLGIRRSKVDPKMETCGKSQYPTNPEYIDLTKQMGMTIIDGRGPQEDRRV